MTVHRLVLTFIGEGFEIRTLYRKRFFEIYTGLKRLHDNERRAWLYGDTETRTLTGRRRVGFCGSVGTSALGPCRYSSVTTRWLSSAMQTGHRTQRLGWRRRWSKGWTPS